LDHLSTAGFEVSEHGQSTGPFNDGRLDKPRNYYLHNHGIKRNMKGLWVRVKGFQMGLADRIDTQNGRSIT